ncbi:unnamed protein product [Heterobilharzia americana]|nr:unnamed protein product [Heterobilharzia americana]
MPVDKNYFLSLSCGELEEISSNLNIQTPKANGSVEESQCLKNDTTEIDVEYLFVRVKYTLKNQIRMSSNKFFVQSSIDRQIYDELCVQACQAEPPIVVLNVSVIEAKNLEAKDLNGFSDPYCILGVIFGRYLGQNEKSTSDNFLKSSSTAFTQNDAENMQPSASSPLQNMPGRKGTDNCHVTFSRSSFRRFSQSIRKRTM